MEEESNILCKEHSKPITHICSECKTLLCPRCTDSHDFSADGGKPISLFKYASESLIPAYTSLLGELEKHKHQIDGINLFNSLPKVLAGLTKVKSEAEMFLAVVTKAVEELSVYKEKPQGTHEEIKHLLTDGRKKLGEAINNDDVKTIVRSIEEIEQSSPAKLVEGGEAQLLENTLESIDKLLDCEYFKPSQKYIKEFAERCKIVLKSSIKAGIATDSSCTYFICYPIESYKRLCKYSIDTKKITPLIKVHPECSILHVGSRLFLTGGSNPNVATCFEYLDGPLKLVEKEPMNYAKYYHSMVVINANSFATIGGYNSNSLVYCEEYSITENKWNLLPNLIKARCSAATVLIGLNDLYTIGGHDSGDTIEKLDLREKRIWETVNLIGKEISLVQNPCSLSVSTDEILILSGGGTSDAGIWNVKTGIIKKIPNPSIKPDYYFYTGGMCVINGFAYITGNYGHTNIYNLKMKTFDFVEHSNALP